jgi:hypothetical protein
VALAAGQGTPSGTASACWAAETGLACAAVVSCTLLSLIRPADTCLTQRLGPTAWLVLIRLP